MGHSFYIIFFWEIINGIPEYWHFINGIPKFFYYQWYPRIIEPLTTVTVLTFSV